MKRHISRTAGALLISSTILCSMSVANIIPTTATASVPASMITSLAPIPLEVPAGCALPKAPKNAFYLDAVNGNDVTGDGSAAKPWKTLLGTENRLYRGVMTPFPVGLLNSKLSSLVTDRTGQEVLNNPTAPVTAGDIIYLKSGNYGFVRTNNFKNSDFITFAAAPGATPIIEGWQSYNSANKLMFKGITFQKAGVLIRGLNTVSDIILDGNTFTEGAEAEHWTPTQWIARGMQGTFIEGTCTTHINNTARFLANGFQAGGDKALIKNNVIDFYWGDGIRFASNNTSIIRNLILNHYGKTGSANHNDAVQGWRLDGVPVGNLVIDSNIVLESNGKYKEIPPIPTGTGSDYLQGISIFDGIWSNIRATNNVIVSSAYHGLSFFGADGLLVSNNTVISALPDGKRESWIGIFNRKDGTPTKNYVIQNNIATTVWGGPNNIQTRTPAKFFKIFDRATATFDFHLLPGTTAIGTGTKLLAPTVDIEGNAQNALVDQGAYAFKAGSTTPPVVPTPTPTPTPAPAPAPAPTLIKHSVMFKANARINALNPAPKMNVVVDGKLVGTVVVDASMHLGQVGTYTVDFVTTTQPKAVSLVLDGYKPEVQTSVQLGVFNVTYGQPGQTGFEILRTQAVTSKVTAGQAKITLTSDVFYTKGATIEWNVSSLK